MNCIKRILSIVLLLCVVIQADISSVFAKNLYDPDDDIHYKAYYLGNLEYVLGDVKQAQIQNALETKEQVTSLLHGFKKMGVNGIRIAIFPEGLNPNKSMYDYFFNEAKHRGFKIFANPALSSGGKRIALGTLKEPEEKVLDKKDKTDALIRQIKAFAQEYPCDWISPFNEDGKPGQTWSVNQINSIFGELYGNLNGAQLIGPCAWGIPASTEVLTSTDIKNYISVATTHNLGFNHDAWDAFKAAAGDLPVWDSETNNNKKFPDRDTRIDAAMKAGVNGLVLYNSWKNIDLLDGSIDQEGMDLQVKYLVKEAAKAEKVTEE